MMQAKSTTLNEFDLDKVRRFTQSELEKLTHSELPFCYQIGTTVLVGRYKVIKVNEQTWRVIDTSSQTIDLFTRKDAIFYCVALHKKQHKVAQEIKDNDSLLGQLEFEAILYRHRYKSANEKSDSWSAEYYSNRYTETMHRIEYVKNELTKSINLAKYIKV
jgi:hypothetical protein